MEEFFKVIKEFENEGNMEFLIKFKEKRWVKQWKKLKESGDEKKIKIAKRLARYYGIFHNMGPITTCPNFPFEEDKYGLYYVHVYLENFVDSAKRSIVGVIKALADDEKLDPFYKYLMFTHFYSPEEIAKINREELSREEESILKGDLKANSRLLSWVYLGDFPNKNNLIK